MGIAVSEGRDKCCPRSPTVFVPEFCVDMKTRPFIRVKPLCLLLVLVTPLLGSAMDPPAPPTSTALPPIPTNTPSNPGAVPTLQRRTLSAPIPARPTGVIPAGVIAPPVAHPEWLAWDSTAKDLTSEVGATNIIVTFSVTNVSTTNVVIRSVRPSCGCTIAKLPSQPWTLQPGDHGDIQASLDLRGKRGLLQKYLSVDSSAGFKLLIFKVHIPENAATSMAMETRGRNLMAALADRQAVFKGTCVSCHVEPTKGKLGAELYVAACGICHDSTHRASMVPDLQAVRRPTREYWHRWTASGKAGTLMPAFAQTEGGPLNDAQITSLVDYLMIRFPPRPMAVSATAGFDPARAARVLPVAPLAPAVPASPPIQSLPSIVGDPLAPLPPLPPAPEETVKQP